MFGEFCKQFLTTSEGGSHLSRNKVAEKLYEAHTTYEGQYYI